MATAVPITPAESAAGAPGVYCDFLGLSYGCRSQPHGGPTAASDDLQGTKASGIVDCCKRMLSSVEKPIYLRENGVCDDHDIFGHAT
jgi:hypothetical protein